MTLSTLHVRTVGKPQCVRRASRGLNARKACATNGVAGYAPPTVADTKRKFLEAYDKPISAIYTTVVQELLVTQHFMRYNIKYQYDEIFALGVVSVFNQVLDGLEVESRTTVFNAYISALSEDPAKYNADAEQLTEWSAACSSPADLKPDENGTEIQQVLAKVAKRISDGDHFYTRFFAIGLFRLLELTDAKDPKALEGLVKALGVRMDSVNKDLLLYKSILSKMMAAKELMSEMLTRDKRKQAEREAAKREAEVATT